MPDATLRSIAKLHSRQLKQFERSTVTYDSTYSVATGAVAGTIIYFVTLPTSARIHGDSFIAWDALGAGTLNLGFAPVDGNFTAAPTALRSGIAVTSASAADTRPFLIADHANNGKLVWELMGLATDPGGFAELIGTTATATTSATGDVTVVVSAHHG